MNFEKVLKFNNILGPALLAFFCEKIKLLWKGSNFTCMFLMMIQICYVCLMKVGEHWKTLKFHDISRASTVSIFYEISHLFWMGSNFTCMFLKMIQICSENLMNLVNFEKMIKFHDISRAGTVGIFLWNKLTFLNGLKFHMHVIDDDSNKFCKFDEIWWTLKKCWNFMIFLGPALSAFFYEIS